VDIQHFLNPPQSLPVRYAAMLFWSTWTELYSYISWFINWPEPMKNIHNFLHRLC
jgi:hypothetical protein